MEIICVPIIVVVVYALIELYKTTIAKTHEKLLSIIPIIGLVLGVALGIMFYYLMPNLISANNLLSAILVGGASGLSATGCNQIFKQLKKYGVTVKQPATEPDELDTETEQSANDDTDTSASNTTAETEQSATPDEATTTSPDEHVSRTEQSATSTIKSTDQQNSVE